MIASYQTIKRLKPIAEMVERSHVYGMTYGLGPAGYDIRIAECITIPSGGFALASAIERFQMPSTLLGVVHDKSTWARRGLTVQNTVIEPGWCGWLTIELTNHAPDKCVLRTEMPIAQVVFHMLDKPTKRPYDGKYQHQPAGPQVAKLG